MKKSRLTGMKAHQVIRKDLIEDEIQRTLDLFDSADQIKPSPNFYAAVQGRLMKKSEQKTLAVFLRPVVLASLLAINLVTTIWYLGSSEISSQTTTRQELLNILVDDLNLETESLDLFNID